MRLPGWVWHLEGCCEVKSICQVQVGGQVDGRRGAASDQSEQPLSDCGRLDSRFGTLWYHWLCRIDQRVFGCIWGFTDGFLSEHGLFFAGDSHKTSLLCKSHRLLTRSWQLLRSGGLVLSFLDTSGNSRSVSSACFYIKNGVNDDNVYCWWLSYIVNIVNGIILMVHNGSANEFLMVLPFLMVTILSIIVFFHCFYSWLVDQFTKIFTDGISRIRHGGMVRNSPWFHDC